MFFFLIFWYTIYIRYGDYMATKKKTTSKTVKKRNNDTVSESVKEIKAHEKRYTFLLVLFFFVLFIIIGYYTLRVK